MKKYYQNIAKPLILTVAALLIIYIGIAVIYRSQIQRPLNIPAEGLVFEIPPGSSIQKVARDLADQSILPNTIWFRLYLRLNSQYALVQAGEYRLQPGMTLPDLVEHFALGKTIEYPVQFLEGWTFADVRRELEKKPKLEQTLSGLSDGQVMAALGQPESHSEGRFFPDTYFYHKGVTDLEILRIALRRMDQILEEEWQQRDSNLPLQSPYEALILASIVEKETGAAFEREKIAGVFIRRLKLGMRLQTDPTVIYGLGEGYSGNLTRKHLGQDSPYNTYKIAGLPPTPIALPGRGSIYAALHPEAGNELYFVARGDGTHEFTATLEQHQKAVVKYQIRQRRNDYRSSPPVAGENGQ